MPNTRKPRKKVPPHQVSVRGSTHEALKHLAKAKGMKVSAVVEQMINRYLDAQEQTS